MGQGNYSEEDLERLYQETSSMIYNLGLRLFRDREEALDFAQDVYVKAFDRLDRFLGRSKFSTWLYSLAMNMGLNRIRKQKRLKPEQGDVEARSLPSSEDHYERLSEKEEVEVIQRELAELPDVYRLPLLLYYYEKMSYSEIAERLAVKEGTLKSYLHRGKTILRDRLSQKGVQP
jgi:RNA polymerase sigma-70 factor (ECF subfamily)